MDSRFLAYQIQELESVKEVTNLLALGSSSGDFPSYQMIEVVDGELNDTAYKLGVINTDPQHSQQFNSPVGLTGKRVSACQRALTATVPNMDTVLMMQRADLDSVIAALIFEWRLQRKGRMPEEMLNRIKLVSDEDLKTPTSSWSEFIPADYADGLMWLISSRKFQINIPSSILRDENLLFDQRLALIKLWLYYGVTGLEGFELVSKSMNEAKMVANLFDKIEKRGDIAILISDYSAPLVNNVVESRSEACIVLYTNFANTGNRKYSVFHRVKKISSISAELNELELGWGGPPTMSNSPMNRSSEIDLDHLVNLYQSFLDKI
ncbi:MAG: hypothetical protein ACRCXZ_08360 [Patescibacteria group bacterium]